MKNAHPLSNAREANIIANFMMSLHGMSMDEALLNAEMDCKSYGLSRMAAREIGTKIRAHYARGGK